MKTTDVQSMKGSCQVWPHGHRDRGPLQVIIGTRSQPAHLGAGQFSRVGVKKAIRPRVHVEQPHDDTNLTIIRVLIIARGKPYPFQVKGVKFHQASSCWKANGELDIRIKNRYTFGLTNIPFGQYRGSTLWTDDWAVMTFQAGGEARAPDPVNEPPTIITPGDPRYANTDTLGRTEESLHRIYGVDGGAPSPGGLRDG